MNSNENTCFIGKENLVVLSVAPNYTRYVKNFLLSFIGKHDALDFGAGNGIYAEMLKACHLNIDCVEIDHEFVTLLKSKGLNVYHALTNIKKKYQRIYSLDVIEHIEDDQQALINLYHSLENGGEILIYVPAFNCLYGPFDKAVGHYRRYTKSSLLPLMKKAGFKISKAHYVDSIGFLGSLYFKLFCSRQGKISEDIKKVTFYYKYIFPISTKLDYIFNRFFGKNLLVIAKK